MGRSCADCGDFLSNSNYSRNQWLKGEGYSRCKNCIDGSGGYVCPSYQCGQCNRTFNSQNELNMHMQVHRPRGVSCPICRETRFRTGANAVQHIESGFCTGCRGADNARQQIYDFASRQTGMRPFMTNTPQLTYGDWTPSAVPDLPYHCQQCGDRSFRQMSQLLQHQDQKHGNLHLLQY